MNALLDESLVALALLVSLGYAAAALGPRPLRRRLLAALSRMLARAPAFLYLGRAAAKLQAASGQKAAGACGGCDNCGAEAKGAGAPTSHVTGNDAEDGAKGEAGSGRSRVAQTQEISVPLASIGRRQAAVNSRMLVKSR